MVAATVYAPLLDPMRTLSIAVVSVFALSVHAQSSLLYGGGSGDGHGTSQGVVPGGTWLWYGGAGDGHAMTGGGSIAAAQLWYGGAGDGHAEAGSGAGSNPVLYLGGSNDGHCAALSNTMNDPALYRGGNGDGHAVAGGASPGAVSFWYGGTNDGHAESKGALQFDHVRVRVKLDGPYDALTGLMRDDLRSQGLLPLNEPYTALGLPLTSNEPAATTTAVWSTTGADAIVDWVYLELRAATNTSLALTTITALLQRDGDIVAMDGTSPPTFRIAAGNYHVVVRHRNHLGIMSAQPLALGWLPQPIDLSTSPANFFGTNATRSVNGTQVLWAGDVTGDGQVRYTGAGNDRDPVLTTVGSTTPNNAVNGTYSLRDVNLDGSVKYTGASNDRDPIFISVGSTTPNNVVLQQVP